jgi:hypothetical protein
MWGAARTVYVYTHFMIIFPFVYSNSTHIVFSHAQNAKRVQVVRRVSVRVCHTPARTPF